MLINGGKTGLTANRVKARSTPTPAPIVERVIPSATPAPKRLNEVETSEPPLTTPDRLEVSESGLILDDRTVVALEAAQTAVRSMPGEYSWDEFRTCSTFISAYLGEFGFPISDRNGQSAEFADPFPWSGTVSQVNWLRRNCPTYVHDAPLIDFLERRLYDRLAPGNVIYLTVALGHNGYDTYYHVAALVGYHVDGEPQFAEMAAGMRSASAERAFSQLTKFYKKRADGSWDVTPRDPRHTLVVTWFDPFAVIRDII